MTYRKRFRHSNGFVLLDVILALTILVVSVAAAMISTHEARAIYSRAQDRLELLDEFNRHRFDFANLMPHEHKEQIYASSTIIADGFWYGNERIETTVSVNGRKSYIRLNLIRNYPFASLDETRGRSLCSVKRVGALNINPISLPINPGIILTDLIVRNGTAYISADPRTSSDPDLYAVNLSTGSLLSSLNTGPGIEGITLAGDYIYAAVLSTIGQLQVIENDPNSLRLINRIELVLLNPSTTPTRGSSVAYHNSKIYLGTEKWDGSELIVFDATSGQNPEAMSGFETNSKINSIYPIGNTLFLGSSDVSQLWEINISNPRVPVSVNTFSPTGWERAEVKSINYFEESVQLGRTSGGFNIETHPEYFNWPSSTSFGEYVGVDIPGGAYGISRDRDHIYLATRTLDKEFMVIDSTGTSTMGFSLPVLPEAMTCDNGSLYILAKTAPIIYEIYFD